MDDLAEQLRQAKTLRMKERLQFLYWLKQENAPSISAIAKAVGKHRNTLQSWLLMYREGGVIAALTGNAQQILVVAKQAAGQGARHVDAGTISL